VVTNVRSSQLPFSPIELEALQEKLLLVLRPLAVRKGMLTNILLTMHP